MVGKKKKRIFSHSDSAKPPAKHWWACREKRWEESSYLQLLGRKNVFAFSRFSVCFFFSLVSLAATSFRDDSLYAFHPPGDLLGGPERASGVAVVVVVGGVGWGDKQRGREEVRRRESEGGRAMWIPSLGDRGSGSTSPAFHRFH